MTYSPGDATRSRQLLAVLAQAPDPQLTTDWANELRELTAAIHTAVHGQSDDGIDGRNHEPVSLTYQSIYHWRNELDRLLAAAEHDDPALWARDRTPGTWLDALLRLRVVLTHVTSKAYWSGHTHINYSDIEIERYLWGAR
ncbi:MAG: hypothetical protein ACRDSR_01405 [Pseudonocardiaceae bacterium]